MLAGCKYLRARSTEPEQADASLPRVLFLNLAALHDYGCQAGFPCMQVGSASWKHSKQLTISSSVRWSALLHPMAMNAQNGKTWAEPKNRLGLFFPHILSWGSDFYRRVPPPPSSSVLPPLLPHSTSHTQYHTSNITHSTLHTQYHTPNITHSTSHNWHHTLNITQLTSHTQDHTLNITH